MIHIKDYIASPSHLNNAVDSSSSSGNNIVSFPEPNLVSKEYIGKFVDQLMQMPEDPHQDLEDTTYKNVDSAMDFVAARILTEENW